MRFLSLALLPSPPAPPSRKTPARYTTRREHAFRPRNVQPSHPEIPASNCQPHVVKAGETILAANEGAVHVVWCYADKAGEHGKGLTLDLMVGTLNVMYVIWRQKIWNPSNGEAPTAWENWRDMEDRGSVTANHQYLVTILFLLSS
ncbi:hypothetical protein ACJ73_07992 [Blastomyces percursus]|uniref:ARB-07466-like C-terminal domain-containing protein n=1 Tax=Blastomyces percursus TaxID=1658174 RepID=A0A1J9PWD6_9EURO|nr:hypothetical protein ACJ73_07992 [Blastomyces percursus]